MKKKLIIFISFLVLTISSGLEAAAKQEAWHPGLMTWQFVVEGNSGTKCLYSTQEMIRHKNGNISLWVGIEGREAFKAIYMTIDPGRKKSKNQKEFTYNKSTRGTTYDYDIMRMLPNRYFITDDGGEWDVIEDDTFSDKIWMKLTGNEPLFQIQNRTVYQSR